MIIENTQDLILVIGSACGAITAILTICYKMSRCEYLNFFRGCFIMKRQLKETKEKENINTLTPSPSESSLDNENIMNV